MIGEIIRRCIELGLVFSFVAGARITHYVPELGGTNCSEPCDRTSYMEPLLPGEGAACGPDVPYGTMVYIDGVGWRRCNDHGGAIDDDNVDALVAPEECVWVYYKYDQGRQVRVSPDDPEAKRWCSHWITGNRDTIWLPPESFAVLFPDALDDSVYALTAEDWESTVSHAGVNPLPEICQGLNCLQPYASRHERDRKDNGQDIADVPSDQLGRQEVVVNPLNPGSVLGQPPCLFHHGVGEHGPKTCVQ